MLRMTESLENEAMKLSPLEKLAKICPPCFGGLLDNPRKSEPDYIVCINGNFQHRRHKAASTEFSESFIYTPTSFLDPNELKSWQAWVQEEVPLVNFLFDPFQSPLFFTCWLIQMIPQDPCSQQHTAANDKRTSSTWRGCDETGLILMACRHDRCLSFINVVKSGERSVFQISKCFLMYTQRSSICQIILCTSPFELPTRSNKVWRWFTLTCGYTLWHWLYYGEGDWKGLHLSHITWFFKAM